MEKLRWGVMGAANIAVEKVIPGIARSANGDVAALASRSADTAAATADRLDIPLSYGSYEDLVASSEIDAVYIPLPNHLHREWTLAAAAAGKHVLCEKPLGMNAAEAEEMVEGCEAAGVTLMEAFMYRLHPQWTTIGELVDSGRIGELRAVQSSFFYFNDDGQTDLATLNLKGPIVKDVGVLIFERVTAGFPVFKEVQNFGVGENPFALKAGDFNNDGNDDLIMLNRLLAASDQAQVFLAQGDGTLRAPVFFDIPCPFFTGGRFCRAQELGPGDFDDNDKLDLAILINDPRVIVSTDAMQVFAGRGDGIFVGGPVFPVGKNPTSVGTGDIIGSGNLDIVVSSKQGLQVQAFVNVSTPGDVGNGEPCFQGDECLSGRCTNGRCCATQCFDFERCDVPSQEGVCVRVDPPVECVDDIDCIDQGRCQEDPVRPCDTNSDCDELCLLKGCRNGFCCDESCRIGENRCDVPGFEGICIPKGETGEECFEDADCSTGFCRDGFCCNQDCQSGACNFPTLEGECQPLLPDGEFCDNDDRVCLSGVCDDFDLICCNRPCFEDEFCNVDGRCETFDFATPTSVPTEDPNTTPTTTPTPTGDQGSACTDGATCDDGLFCVNNVCCAVSQCNEDQHCELGTGTCVEGPPPTATATPTPTPTQDGQGGTTRTRTPVPGNCDASCPPQNCQPDGTCILSSRSGGSCAMGEPTADGRDALILALLPIGLWLGRRRQLRRAEVRVRTRR